MSLATNIQDFATRAATEFKAVRAVMGALSSLTTTNKTDLVSAINEVKASIPAAGVQINDTTASTTTVYSSSRTEARISAVVQGVIGAAPAALDTLTEPATALGNDANFATTINTALGNRVRFDAAQTLTGAQQIQARANIGAGTSNLTIGTTAGTAKDGAYQPAAANISDASAIGRSVLTAIDGPTIRGAIGAGTSSLALGTTAGTAKAGDYAPPAATTGAAGLIQLAGMLGGTATAPTVRAATDALAGVVELATPAEVVTGTSGTLATTPAGVKGVTDLLATKVDVGDTATDFVAAFNAGLV